MMSGQAVSSRLTTTAAMTTARFSTASLRENIQTALTFELPARCGRSTTVEVAFTISTTMAQTPVNPASGT